MKCAVLDSNLSDSIIVLIKDQLSRLQRFQHLLREKWSSGGILLVRDEPWLGRAHMSELKEK